MIIEHDKGQVIVQYNVKADPYRVAEFKDKLAVCEDGSAELRVVGRPVEYSEAELRKLAGELVEGRDKWAPQLGITDILSAEVDLRTGAVLVETSQTEEPVIDDRFGVLIRIRGGGSRSRHSYHGGPTRSRFPVMRGS
jgi:hypothetical protein